MPNALVNHTGDQPFERFNAAPPTQLAIFHQEGQYLHADMVRWGWRPHWAKDRAAPINDRVEKVAHGPFFRAIWPHRAIIAINNWFEWSMRAARRSSLTSFAGETEHRSCAPPSANTPPPNPPGEHDGFVIITADIAGGMVDIHDRRPVTLSPELAREWLDPDTPKDRAELMALQQGEPTEAFEWFMVDRAIGNVRNQGRELLKPKEEEHPN